MFRVRLGVDSVVEGRKYLNNSILIKALNPRSSQMEHCEIMNVVLSDKKGYLTLNVTFNKEGKIMLRSSAGINIWHSLLQVGLWKEMLGYDRLQNILSELGW